MILAWTNYYTGICRMNYFILKHQCVWVIEVVKGAQDWSQEINVQIFLYMCISFKFQRMMNT